MLKATFAGYSSIPDPIGFMAFQFYIMRALILYVYLIL